MQQVMILRSQSGRKLNARDYQAVINAHHQSTSVYDYPEAVVRTACHCETAAADGDDCEADCTESVNTNKAADHIKKPKIAGRPRIKGHRPGKPNSGSTTGAVTQRKHLPSTENPYAKPTYRSFEWMLPARRRSSVTDDDTSAVKRKRRRKLFASITSTSQVKVSGGVDEDCTNSSSADFSVGKLFLDVTGSDVIQGQETSLNRSPLTNSVKDHKWDDGKGRLDFTPNVSPHRDKIAVSVNGTVDCDDKLLPSAGNPVCIPYSSTPLKRSPLHPFDETRTSDRTSTASPSQPRFNVSKLQARHFSDILVDQTSPSSPSRNRTASQNDEDTFIDVVSDVPVPPSASSHSVNDHRPMHNGFAGGLSRLSKAKTKKHFAAGGLVNGLRQRTLDSFVRRMPNGNRCPNGFDDTVENVATAENESLDLKHSSLSSVKLKQTIVDRVNETGETSDKNTSDERTADGDDSFVDMDSIEGVWRRRTSLRSSTAFMNLLGPDLAQLT